MNSYARFIPDEEIGTAEPWDFSAVDTASLLLAAQVRARRAAASPVSDDAIRQEGYAEGFAQGHAQATLEGQKQIDDYITNQGTEAANNFAGLFESAQSGLANAEQMIACELLELACDLARQIVRHELSINPNALQPVVREALGLLVAESKSVLVRLNPLDLEILDGVVREEFPGLALTLTGDASVTRGGCLVESNGTVVDGTLEKRWTQAIASLGLSSTWEPHLDEQ